MRYNDDSGFTILEMIVVIALIGIVLGLTGFGLSSIYNSSVTSNVNTLMNEIRLLSSREQASSKNDYELILSYDTAEKAYIARTYIEMDGAPREITKTMTFPKSIIIEKDGLALSDATFNDVNTRSFRFSPSSGGLLTEGAGVYTIKSTASSITKDMVVVAFNGRVYLDE